MKKRSIHSIKQGRLKVTKKRERKKDPKRENDVGYNEKGRK
jgi:hypothetical protein